MSDEIWILSKTNRIKQKIRVVRVAFTFQASMLEMADGSPLESGGGLGGKAHIILKHHALRNIHISQLTGHRKHEIHR